ncbi:hypothetical protein SNOG_20098 [Parastagonospora nodorum SN15]|uniref:Uncharacterized protein n=1 Tax=Phaeosphaeria nodorum (strain SN15 / ATCC MYA-4574 / FGSC 10173) TaxID=321614 RepID=A9JX95_PHANO|nr:hypothetical protein SNOG_20098 [Parastagonospora nodorum SN15]EDP89787.1 hypothetical protein SNOG_20098 [Parastagonospora nodorum SN15]
MLSVLVEKGAASIVVKVVTLEVATTAELSIMLFEGKQPTQGEGVADALGVGQMERVIGAVGRTQLELAVDTGIGETLIVAFLLSVENGGTGRSVLETLPTGVVAESVVVGIAEVDQLKLDSASVVAGSVVIGTAEINELELVLWLTMMVLVSFVVE